MITETRIRRWLILKLERLIVLAQETINTYEESRVHKMLNITSLVYLALAIMISIRLMKEIRVKAGDDDWIYTDDTSDEYHVVRRRTRLFWE